MKVCSVSGCGRKHYARGYCSKHHQQWWKTGSAEHCKIIPPLLTEMYSIPGVDGYAASKDGFIWSCRKFGGRCGFSPLWVKLKPYADKDGYLWVRIYRDGKTKREKIAHLVLETFFGPRPLGAHSLHYPDRDVRNNRVENLRWGTQQENSNDMIKMGTQACGISNGQSKLTEQDVRAIRAINDKTGRSLAREYKVSPEVISAIKTGKIWKHLGARVVQ